MIYAGIDIAKLNHFASVISSDGEVLVEPFRFSNDLEGFRNPSPSSKRLIKIKRPLSERPFYPLSA